MLSRICISFVLTAAGLAASAFAQTEAVTFAQFTQKYAGTPFVFDNTGSGATFNTTNAAVNFTYLGQGFANELAVLNGVQDATLTIASNTVTAATGTAPKFDQIIDSGYFEFRRNTAIEGKNLLLRVDFTKAQLELQRRVGSELAYEEEANFCSHHCVSIAYSSDFLQFDNSVTEGWAIAFTSVFPPAALGSNNQLNDFSASGSGTFDAAPSVMAIPEPSTYALGIGAAVFGFVCCHRRRRTA